MSLGFHNEQFPDACEYDKIADYYKASYHYNTAVTASNSVSESYSDSIPRGSGTTAAAIADNGNIFFIYEGQSAGGIVESRGGTVTSVSTGFSSPWRGVNYDPKSNKFVALANRALTIDADSPHTTNSYTTFFGSQIWGGQTIDGTLYYGPAFGSATQLAGFDYATGNSAYVTSTFSSNTNFMSPCLDIDGRIVFGPEGDGKVKIVDVRNDSLDTLTSSELYWGYEGMCPLPDGRLFNFGWNSSNYVIYTPASLNGGTSKIDIIAKGVSIVSGPWSNCFIGLDGRAYYVNSRGRNQLGGTYSDVYCYDPIENNFFETQFKFPAGSTGNDRNNQAIIVQPDGWVFSAGSRSGATQHHYVKMFEPNNTITIQSRTAGFSPNSNN